MGDRALRYLVDLARIDTSNPPGNETKVADYLKQQAAAARITCELIGAEPARPNFIAFPLGTERPRVRCC